MAYKVARRSLCGIALLCYAVSTCGGTPCGESPYTTMSGQAETCPVTAVLFTAVRHISCRCVSFLNFLEVCVNNAVITGTAVRVAAHIRVSTVEACGTAHVRISTRLTAVLLVYLGGQCVECLLQVVGLCLDRCGIISAQCTSQVCDLALDCGLFVCRNFVAEFLERSRTGSTGSLRCSWYLLLHDASCRLLHTALLP